MTSPENVGTVISFNFGNLSSLSDLGFFSMFPPATAVSSVCTIVCIDSTLAFNDIVSASNFLSLSVGSFPASDFL